MSFAIYSLSGKTLAICGIPITQGQGFVKLEVESPEAYTTVKSSDGLMTRCETGDTEYKLKLTLLSSSSLTAKFMALHIADRKSPGGAGVGPFVYSDGTGETTMGAPYCFITKPPLRVIGAQVAEETWEITASSDVEKMFLGGNSIT